ncbi:unnamed protein product [Symbiodinium sp. CCMP2456]|nr:unnamed protein product [Symbiodinium sp. CCMP2456]
MEQASPRKGKKRRVSALEMTAGMSLDASKPKQTVHTFLCRRSDSGHIKKGVDYSYASQENDKGIVSMLTVPLFNDRSYTGDSFPTQQQAERSAAESFLADLDVVAAAKTLPPPRWLLQRHARETTSQLAKGVKHHRREGGEPTRFKVICDQKASALYRQYR